MSFRVGATVLVGCDGNAIQSYYFKDKRFLGNLQQVLKFLDEYEVDEVHIIVPSKGDSDCNSLQIFSDLSNVSISTPLGIGGGLTMENIGQITQEPFFERCIFNGAIFDNFQLLKRSRIIMGHQSMVALIPFMINNDMLLIYNSKRDAFQKVESALWEKINSIFNEIILLDVESEGSKEGFNFEVFEHIEFPIERILISGGLTRGDIDRAKNIGLAGVSIDNFALHSEYSIEELR